MLKVNNVSKFYRHPKENFQVLDNITANIADGEFVTVFGPNGAGKSTFLYLIAGLDKPNSGEIVRDENDAGRFSTGFVFQDYNDSLLPWKTVLENVALPLRAKGMSIQDAENRSRVLLSDVGLDKHTEKYPYQLSGGLKQLTAIARAFSAEPNVLLLDEPTSSLDYLTTKLIEKKILELWGKQKITTICISHDPDEAIFLADRILVFSQRPAIIKDEIIIDLPRPRNFDMVTGKAFIKYRQRLLKDFDL